MRAPLTIAVAQPACAAYDVAHNARTHAELVRAAQARVVVFPELSLTGYHMDAPAIAADDPRLAPLVEACRELGSTALVGAPLAGARGPHIAMLAIERGAVHVAYRKLCVAPGEERFQPGEGPCVREVDGFRLGLAICRDVMIPEHAQDTAALGIDAYVAGTLNAEQHAPYQSARARRIAQAHGVWVAFASFAGATGEGYARSAGHSGIWAPSGELVAQVGLEPGAFARATLR